MTDDLIAVSTIAMTAYNVLAMAAQPTDAHGLHPLVLVHHPKLPIAKLEEALQGLCQRRYVSNVGIGYALVDSSRRFVRNRSRFGDGWQIDAIHLNKDTSWNIEI